ncbi:diaminopimelate decarboxylase [Bifidobacterium mongoliense]|jgi:diaminopimelate decarboxylase|uniref:Diaminopimelate decarboxylase n=1 Tax=Bifidobacterium mongoliense TaxID=518643 RepID=A0A423UCC4_9BIFI|nr:diaminopimelate decarboxylase [Bifidobacterium mongoliense]MDN5979475.1 diaminopimelate decarboxylase [Bifidobacterium mongoliense]MDN6485235.1 diaminopimelate decarboxylase [Bifidobacterium mongoliense]MDN6768296.1 diaminopimelate decarboxylase [Bifidobacterium mongoliense]MDN6782946.1 diaminopimelate decarboxylase [Bifidobacterium mongoliense]MDN6802089.1 diaminopimelate decarboxylase [Bifidobacterium mongoliense]
MAVTSIWPEASAVDERGEVTFHGHTAQSLVREFGSPLYVVDTDEIRTRARRFVRAAAEAFAHTTTHVSFAAKSFISKEVLRLVTGEGMFVDTCTMGEMRIALAAGVPGRRLVLHGNNKSDAEIELAVREGFAKIVVDSPDEPARIAAIAHRLGKRAKVMLRVTVGIHAGGHEYISTAHEDQKFGVGLLSAGVDPSVIDVIDRLIDHHGGHGGQSDGEADGRPDGDVGSAPRYRMRYPYDLDRSAVDEDQHRLIAAMTAVSQGPALGVLRAILALKPDLELVGIHSHIGSQIHDAGAFIEAAKRMMLLRRTCYDATAYMLPEVDLGGGFSVAYTDDEDAMDVGRELARLAAVVTDANTALGMPEPNISFEPGRWIVAPAGVTLYTVGTVKHVALPAGTLDRAGRPLAQRVYVSVDGGMSDNIRPALYDAEYTARLANRAGSETSMTARVVGMHCESGDILVHECPLPADLRRGDVLAIPVTGAYGRTMASNYNQALIPAVVGVGEAGAHVMIRRQTIDDLLGLDLG